MAGTQLAMRHNGNGKSHANANLSWHSRCMYGGVGIVHTIPGMGFAMAVPARPVPGGYRPHCERPFTPLVLCNRYAIICQCHFVTMQLACHCKSWARGRPYASYGPVSPADFGTKIAELHPAGYPFSERPGINYLRDKNGSTMLDHWPIPSQEGQALESLRVTIVTSAFSVYDFT